MRLHILTAKNIAITAVVLVALLGVVVIFNFVRLGQFSEQSRALIQDNASLQVQVNLTQKSVNDTATRSRQELCKSIDEGNRNIVALYRQYKIPVTFRPVACRLFKFTGRLRYRNVQPSAGPAGPVGVRGAQGPRGPIGLTGPQGKPGLPGTSVVGPRGETGETGAQGSRGLTGETGASGDTGGRGPAGPQGPPGPEGPQGPPGPQGPEGPPGPAGPPSLGP